MKCQRCGADNSDQAEWCYLCEYPFRKNVPGEGVSGTPQESVPPLYSQPGQARDYPQSMPGQTPGYPQPMPGQPPGYPPPPPGVYPPGYPMAPPEKDSKTTRVLIGILAIIGIIVIGGAALYLTLGKSATIQVPIPPGWENAPESQRAELEASSSQQGQDVTIDYLFSDGSLANFIAVGHGKAYIMDSPSSNDLKDIEDFFTRHKDELKGEFEMTYKAMGANFALKSYEVKEMSCGIPALLMSITASNEGTYISQDFLFSFKDNTMYFAIVNKMGSKTDQQELDYLVENISFK
jgi:hypothetical protein